MGVERARNRGVSGSMLRREWVGVRPGCGLLLWLRVAAATTCFTRKHTRRTEKTRSKLNSWRRRQDQEVKRSGQAEWKSARRVPRGQRVCEHPNGGVRRGPTALSPLFFVHGGLVRRAAEERGQRRQQRGSGDARGADIRRVVAIPDDTPLVVAPAGAAFHSVKQPRSELLNWF